MITQRRATLAVLMVFALNHSNAARNFQLTNSAGVPVKYSKREKINYLVMPTQFANLRPYGQARPTDLYNAKISQHGSSTN